MNEALQSINQIPNINRGGCGCVALALYKYMVSQGLIVDIVYLYDSLSQEAENQARLLSSDYLGAPSHIMIKYNDIFIDSRGIHLFNDIKLRYRGWHEVSRKDLENTLNSLDIPLGWNRDFSRSYVRVIETELQVDLSEINTYNYKT